MTDIEEKAVGIAEIIWHDRYFRKGFFRQFYDCLHEALKICDQKYPQSQLDSFRIAVPKWRFKREIQLANDCYRLFKIHNSLEDRKKMRHTRYFWFMDGISKKRTELDCWDTVRVFDGQILPCGSCCIIESPHFMQLKAKKTDTLTQLIVHEIVDALESKDCCRLQEETKKRNSCANGYKSHEKHHDQIILAEQWLYNRFHKKRPDYYTPFEDEQLRILYPKASRETLEKELKFRSWKSIRSRAYDLGIKRI